MLYFIILISLILLILGIYYFYFKRHKNIKRDMPIDPLAQKIYEQAKSSGEEIKTLTLEEKIELSWQFIKNITEQIRLKFSPEDQQQVRIAGQKMIQYGMQYQHQVNMNIKNDLAKASVKVDAKKETSLSK